MPCCKVKQKSLVKKNSLLEYAGSILCAAFILIETGFFYVKNCIKQDFVRTFITVQPLLARFFQGRHHKRLVRFEIFRLFALLYDCNVR